MYNRGTKYLEKGNLLKALACFKKETRSFKELYLNMGNCYRGLGDYSRAALCYTEANSSSVPLGSTGKCGPYSLALNNLGMLSYGLGDDDSAIAYYKSALSVDPLHYDAIWNLGNAVLRQSNCSLGWDLYEYRFKRNSGAVKIETYGIPWDGSVCGDSIIVLAEQGLGDKIMFSRYLKYLKEYFSEVYVQCHPSLDVFYSSYKIVRDAASSGATYSIGICSLAKVFGVVNVEGWLDGKFEAHSFDGFNIGVVWAGSPTHVNNGNRSCPSSYMRELTRFGNVYSLSPDAMDVAGITALKPASWSETASYVLGLDLVVSVDTSIVHLCGTLGVPCIMVQPLRETDFRWSGAWYDSVVVVSNPNSWDLAFSKVNNMLEAICTEK